MKKVLIIITLLALSSCYPYAPQPQERLPMRTVTMPVQSISPTIEKNGGVIEMKFKITIDRTGNVKIKE